MLIVIVFVVVSPYKEKTTWIYWWYICRNLFGDHGIKFIYN